MKVLLVTLATLLFMACSKEHEAIGQSIQVTVGDRTFAATLYDNQAGRAFRQMLPMTIHMSELNGNEKYYYLPQNLPTSASAPATLRTGDIMLYGENCLALFYKTFANAYRYTPVGYINNPSGLQEALGTGAVTLSFALSAATGVSETEEESFPFTVVSSPDDSRISVEGACVRLSLLGTDGRVILSVNSSSLLMNNVPQGIYLLRVDTGKKIYTQKIIK